MITFLVPSLFTCNRTKMYAEKVKKVTDQFVLVFKLEFEAKLITNRLVNVKRS